MKKLFNVYVLAFSLCLFVCLSALGVYNLLQDSYDYKSMRPFFDVQPTVASYVYAPGIFGTEMLMARYNPCFIASTGEKLTSSAGGYVIDEPHTAVVFPEIDLRKPGYWTFNPFTYFANKVRSDLYPLLARVFQESFDFKVEDNPDSNLSVINYGFNFGQANGGQHKDIQALKKACDAHYKKYPDTGVILYGDSRGADTIFSYIAEYHPPFVKAAVLEGLVDDLEHQIKHFIYSDKEQKTENRIHSLLSFLMGSYKKNGMCPRKAVEYIDDDIPLLLVISLKDGLVHPQGVFYVYQRLKERGHQKIHMLILHHSSHPCYMIAHQEDRHLYESVVHAFYKQYHLPHNSYLAQIGRTAFTQTQPTIDEIKQMYPMTQCSWCEY